MPEAKVLEEAVHALPPSALAKFRRWIASFDSAAWDRQLETDASTGKLDALLAEAEGGYKMLKDDSFRPSLQFKLPGGGKTYSARVGVHYRMLGLPHEGGVHWFWIGTHTEYDRLVDA